jgi:hypothetical protein
MSTLLAIATLVPASATPIGWAHQTGGFPGNGAVTVKSLAGGLHEGWQNPTGAVVKPNQNAVTQTPTVIVQASGSTPFNYSSDCYVLYGPYGTYVETNVPFIAAGRIDPATNKFTGVMGRANGGWGGVAVFSALAAIGAPSPSSSNPGYVWCGSDFSCNGLSSGNVVIGVSNLTTNSWQRCYG